MNNADLVTMIGNLSRSLFSLQALISGLAYIIGIVFMIKALEKLKKIGDARASSSSHEKMFVPLAYFLGGAALIFLPSMFDALSNTAFGVGNVLQYIPYNPYNIYSTMGILIQTAGLVWFVRGCVLISHASEPGVKEGSKGLAFIIAGILAMNFDGTVSVVNEMIDKLMSFTGKKY